jgi:hypothetical protein
LSRGVAVVAVALSVALGAFGVVSALAPVLGRGDALSQAAAWVALGVLSGGLLVSEVAAALALLHASRRGQERGGASRRAGAWVVFAAATAVNLGAGAYGVAQINAHVVAPQRAPMEAAAQAAAADVVSRTQDLDRFDAAAAADRVALNDRLQAAPQAVTAGATAARTLAEDQSRRRAALVTALERARQGEAEAVAALSGAPQPFGWWQKLAFAILLELLKGVFLWVATPALRPRAAVVEAAPTFAVVDRQTARTLVASATSEELDALASYGALLAATVRHERVRRGQAARLERLV